MKLVLLIIALVFTGYYASSVFLSGFFPKIKGKFAVEMSDSIEPPIDRPDAAVVYETQQLLPAKEQRTHYLRRFNKTTLKGDGKTWVVELKDELSQYA